MHYSKVKLAKIYSDMDDICKRCKMDRADLLHMFWSCSRLREFWASIFKVLNEAFDLDLQPSPTMAVFGVKGGDIVMSNGKESVVAFVTLITSTPPKASTWLSDIMMFLKIEKIKYFLRGLTRTFYKNWDPLLAYFERLTTRPS